MPKILKTGTRLLSIEFRNVKLIDSLSFMPMRLASFAKTFGIKETVKGHFPHHFNKPENQNFVGKVPKKEMYGYKHMNDAIKKDFDLWYDENLDFDFQKEFVKYCKDDVELLARGCLKFRNIIYDLTKVEPYRKSITIASLCHFIFRNYLMELDQIPLISDKGYNAEQKTSRKAFMWLKFISESKKIELNHSRNGGEKKFGKYSVDAYDAKNNTIYE